MIIYRTFDGDNYAFFTESKKAYSHVDKIANNNYCGPNGFVIIEEIEIALPNGWGEKFIISLLNGNYETERVERIYERFAR